MTEGRFESKVHNGQSGPLQSRPHWSTYNRDKEFPFRKFSEEVQYKESFPFHDLRSEGQFQPETWGEGGTEGAPNNDYLLRKPGGRLNCQMSRSHGVGCGGNRIPIDSAPQPPKDKPRGDKPWTCTPRVSRTFSEPPYQTSPPINRPHPKTRPSPPGHFKAGLLRHPSAPYPHMFEHRRTTPRHYPLRLSAGKTSGQFDQEVLRGPRAVSASAQRRTKPLDVAKMTTNIRKTLHGTFSRYPEHIPDEYADAPVKPRGDDSGKAKKMLRPIYTWSVKTKRSMPVSSAWTVQKLAPDS